MKPLVLAMLAALSMPACAQELLDDAPVLEKVGLVSSISPVGIHTADYLAGLAYGRSEVILNTLPNTADRTERIRGVISLVDSPKPFMDALPKLIDGTPVPLSASLRAYDKMMGYEQPAALDAWIKTTFAVISNSGNTVGQLGAVAVGVDRLLNDDVLLGAFAQSDGNLRGQTADPTLARTGWTVGGYGTWRFSENLFLDAMAGHSTSGGFANPEGYGADQFRSQNWLATAALTGKWEMDNVTFTPQARLRYFDESNVSFAALDGANTLLSSGELTLGQGVSFKLSTANKVVVETGVKLETATKLTTNADTWTSLTSQVEGTVGINLPTGPQWKTSIGYSGIGSNETRFTAKGSLMAPIH